MTNTYADSWTFQDSEIVEIFDSHVEQSVPGYHLGHNLILSLMKNLAFDDAKVLDVGCSTGTLLNKMAYSLPQRRLNLTGIDTSEQMITRARQKLTNQDGSTKINFHNGDIYSLDQSGFDIIISYYTLQFLNYIERRNYIKALYDSLEHNGYFILFEKVLHDNSLISDAIKSAYWDFKSLNNLSDKEIFDKHSSLRGTMFPVTEKQLEQEILSTGFSNYFHIQKNYFFNGYLIQK